MNELATFSGPSAGGVGGDGDATFKLVLCEPAFRSKISRNGRHLQSKKDFSTKPPGRSGSARMNFSGNFAVIDGIDS